MPRIALIEALRGLAALLVLLFHTTEGFQKLFNLEMFGSFFLIGRYGVDIFFVLSGFIIYYVHSKDIGRPEAIYHYGWRRFSRIYPVYWVACTFVLILYACQGRVDGKEFDLESIVRSYLLISSEKRSLLVVSWTLNYEIIFYFLFGCLILNRRFGIALFTLWASLILLNIFSYQENVLTHPRNLEFFLGIGLARIFSKWHQLTQFRIPMLWQFLGTASYSIYLVHVPILLLSFKLIEKLSLLKAFQPELLFLVSAVLALGAGCVFHLIVERPIQNLFKIKQKVAI